ncbi:hypothetical protein [Carboxylicivirga linearis]|uniref:DUF3575 domain-containing protein n=1 Tax=Carboxylicivirga linearis TaxID=1628157 RepID=A0ABS5JX69_9BACT|nr:hypothetical protein [Carboxylicivirga linearis]MBS2099424.1 hypothetical protein [Carboxylicivirga linearis]
MKKGFTKVRRSYVVALAVLLFSVKVNAQSTLNTNKEEKEKWISPAKTAINVCPGGFFMGFYSANVEHLFGENHGVVLRGDLETIPQSYSDAEIDANGKAVILNYRYHIGGGLNSSYAGIFSRYRKIKGDGTLESGKFNFSLPEYTIGLNVGKRWIWKSGITLNFALGYGYAIDNLTVSNSSQDAMDAIDVFRDDYTFMNGFLGEFSLGYAF